MTHFLQYFGFRFKMVRHGFTMRRAQIAKGAVVPAFFLFVAVFMFVFLFKAFRFFQSFDLVGEILIGKLLALIFFIFFIFLVLSNINGVIKWFLTNEDLPFLLTNPVSTSSSFLRGRSRRSWNRRGHFCFSRSPYSWLTTRLSSSSSLSFFCPSFFFCRMLLFPTAWAS